MAIYDLIVNNRNETTLELSAIQLSEDNKNNINQLLKEFKHIQILNKYNLPVNNKLFLYGHTGCGKTTTAKAIASALNKKIFIINLGQIVSSRLGETAKNIAAIFKKAINEKAVLFLDEFDYIGKARDFDTKDSGEMKRLVNTIIQLIDHLPTDTLLIAATNHASIIDTALLRRFQLKLKFDAPSNDELDLYYDTLVKQFPEAFRNINRRYSISYAEAKDIAFNAIKNNVIELEEAKEKK
ncbi:ATP-binding protein [Flavobacteriaceae bacterium F08102]|nr:ATP-binding protein [Flavobacteriaceae bacterium F08102]